MIECIFTIDYELYGNGEGSLAGQVLEPTETLTELFLERDKRFVTFVEVAELEIIEANGTDSVIDAVKRQIKSLYTHGFEIGLHIHPQWYNARYEKGRWRLDSSEYNLCVLPQERIEHILRRAIHYLQTVLKQPDFAPVSFRNGNWLFQPSQPLATILAEFDFKVDSSVFKGGYQHKHGMDYRKSLKNGYYWKFNRDVNRADPQAVLIEIPTFTNMVFAWKMLGQKRAKLQHLASSTYPLAARLNRLQDFVRIRQPLKLDYCRLSLRELISLFERVRKADIKHPESFKPVVAIGHTKDLVDFETVERFLDYLNEKNIPIATFEHMYKKCERTP